MTYDFKFDIRYYNIMLKCHIREEKKDNKFSEVRQPKLTAFEIKGEFRFVNFFFQN